MTGPEHEKKRWREIQKREMRPKTQHYIMKVMTRSLQNKWRPGEKISHNTAWYLHKLQRAQTVHFDLDGRITAIISPWRTFPSLAEILLQCQHFGCDLFFVLFFITCLQVILPKWHNPFSSSKGQNLKQTILFQFKCVIYYFKQLIHSLGIHV